MVRGEDSVDDFVQILSLARLGEVTIQSFVCWARKVELQQREGEREREHQQREQSKEDDKEGISTQVSRINQTKVYSKTLVSNGLRTCNGLQRGSWGAQL